MVEGHHLDVDFTIDWPSVEKCKEPEQYQGRIKVRHPKFGGCEPLKKHVVDFLIDLTNLNMTGQQIAESGRRSGKTARMHAMAEAWTLLSAYFEEELDQALGNKAHKPGAIRIASPYATEE
jgi:hypothetical protein